MRPHETPIAPLLTRGELAVVLGVAPSTTKRRHWLELLGIPALRINGLLRFRREDVESALVRLAAESRETRQHFRLIDRRTDGTMRVVAELSTLAEAEAARAALRSAGSPHAEIVPVNE